MEARSLVSLVTRGDPAMMSLRGLARADTGEYVCQVIREYRVRSVRCQCDVCRPGTPLAQLRPTSISMSTVSSHHSLAWCDW